MDLIFPSRHALFSRHGGWCLYPDSKSLCHNFESISPAGRGEGGPNQSTSAPREARLLVVVDAEHFAVHGEVGDL
ncbi:MAG: hypothetical protein AAGM22_00005, partial [Acidobacteriota bacterium]